MPVDIPYPILTEFPRKEPSTAQRGMLLAKRDHLFEEPEDPSVLLEQRPIEPTDLVVLAIGIVIAALCSSDFIAG